MPKLIRDYAKPPVADALYATLRRGFNPAHVRFDTVGADSDAASFTLSYNGRDYDIDITPSPRYRD